jgi:hypothetical protein
MPILTAHKLATRSRQARFAIDHCTAPPTSVTELRARIAARPKSEVARAVVYIFGPVSQQNRATSYGPHFAVGVTDHENLKSFSSQGPIDLRTIEEVLAGILEEFPSTAGHDVVLTTIPATGEMWAAGLKADYDLRECHAKARRIAQAEGLKHVWYVRT